MKLQSRTAPSLSRLKLAGLAALAIAMTSPVSAAPLADAANDFLPSYTGPQNGDLDVLSVQALFDGTSITLSALLNGPVGTTAGASYIWGIDRGAGTARLAAGTPSVGSGVLFDAVAAFRPNGTGSVTTFPAVGAPTVTNLAANAITINGSFISGVIPLSLLPSRGFAPDQYRFNLWPRSGAGNAAISDFAPNNSTFAADVVPEPASWMLLLAGLGLTAGVLRQRRTGIVLRTAN